MVVVGDGGDKLSPLAFVYVLVFIHGLIQIFYPEIFIKLKFQGAHTPKGVKVGGYIAIFISIILFIYELVQ